MHWQIIFDWAWFCFTLGLAGITTIIMSRQAKNFYTHEGNLHSFSIIDLEIAATPQAISNIIKGIFLLPQDQQGRSLKALKGQLLVDFIFMPAMYGAIFFACMHVSWKMNTSVGRTVFVSLAWLQGLCWLCDIIENIYLLNKIKPTVTPSTWGVHLAYQRMELVKWGFSLTGAVCAIAALLFFWISGNYWVDSLPYLGIVLAEVIIFMVGVRSVGK